ncbi:MAG: hypothetical protein E7391_08945 [Ruminococcaceae bacterium]|nr:hypothetical protein [Oscillospiraceae bacterium]
MKRFLSLILSVAMILSCFSCIAFADGEIKITLNGTTLTTDQPPIIVEGRTLVPVRVIFEALGATVTWDDSIKTATGVLDGTTVSLQINNTVAKVNGKDVTLDVPAQIVNSRTLVPVRFISESLGCKVDWDDATKTVIIESAKKGAVKEWTFDDVTSFTEKKDFIMGANYEAKNVSLSTDVDHTTGNGKSLKMENRTKADHRVKLLGAFTSDMVGKTYKISAWVYLPESAGSVSLAAYSDVGTEFAYMPAAYKTVEMKDKQWTQIELIYKHENPIVTQIGFDQRPASLKCVSLIYVDDIIIEETAENTQTEQKPNTPSDEVKAVTVTDGHRPVPTNFTTGKGFDDIIYFTRETTDNDKLLAALPEGKVVVDENILLNKVGKSTGSQYGTSKIIDVEGMPFKKAVRVDVTEEPTTNPYAIQFDFGTPLEGKAEDGDVMLLKLYMRTEKGGNGESQNGQVQVVIEENGGQYSKVLTGNVINGYYWKVFYFPFTFKANHTRATIRLGYYVQTVDLGGYEIVNYGKNVSINDLPSNSGEDPELRKDAPWRREAWDRIEKIRKGDIKVVVKDAAGNAVPDAKVDVNMYEHEFQFGVAVNNNIYSSEKYKSVVQTNFNAAVPENQTKWVEHEKAPDKTIAMYDTLKNLGIKYLRGHVLVWDRKQVDENGKWKENTSIPEDLIGLYNDKTAMQKRINDHIVEITSKTNPYFTEWDVLNEACNNKVMQDIYGREIINEWFDMARKALGEDAILYYNDFKMNDELFNLLDIMKANNVDFDGIGIQSHYGSVVAPTKTYDFYDRLYKTYGKRLKITEYDFQTGDQLLQASYTRDMLITAFSHEAVDGFIMWGFKGGTNNKYVLYDNDWNEKKGLEAWQDLIYNKWWTDESGTTDANGTFATRGFYGDYDITVTVNGVSKTVSVPCHKGNDNLVTITLD